MGGGRGGGGRHARGHYREKQHGKSSEGRPGNFFCGNLNEDPASSWDEGACYVSNNHQSYADSVAMLVQPERSLADQWRFVCRILERYTPLEPVLDVRRQVQLADHVTVKYTRRGFSEQHGLVCGVPGWESNNGNRRADRQLDGYWVVHWSEDRLFHTPLAQFAMDGQLFKVRYPVWACDCYVPPASTMKPHVEQEQFLDAIPDEAVAKEALSLYRSAAWSPRWQHAPDLEFCIFCKAGASLYFELQPSNILSRRLVDSVGCLFRGDLRPSEIFGDDCSAPVRVVYGAGKPGKSSGRSQLSRKPGKGAPEARVQATNMAGAPSQPPWNSRGSGRAQLQLAAHLQQQPSAPIPTRDLPPHHRREGKGYGSNSSLSAAALEFVPSTGASAYVPSTGGAPSVSAPAAGSWDGIYQ